MRTQRFNPDWLHDEPNSSTLGLGKLLWELEFHRKRELQMYPPPKMRMLEIGSYMGESAMMFASTNLFYEIHCVEPFQGEENYNDWQGYDWEFIENEFKTNTRFFDNIVLHKDYSYNIIDDLEDKSFDFIYIDGNHEQHEVERDITMCLPKLKKDGVIAGHDYHKRWPGVMEAVDKLVGKPDWIYRDTSWIKYEIQTAEERSTKPLL